jgi:hypothetical protein
MRHAKLGIAVIASGILITGCVALVPGAAQVRITDRAPDIAGCRPVGNVRTKARDPVDIENDMRDQAVGLNANAILRTTPASGVAYRCGGQRGS